MLYTNFRFTSASRIGNDALFSHTSGVSYLLINSSITERVIEFFNVLEPQKRKTISNNFQRSDSSGFQIPSSAEV